MIVCDKCGHKAEYFITVDYLRNKAVARFDLCEKHYQELESLIHPPDIKAVEEEPNGSQGQAKRGRPRKAG
jgi:hypothetical protein